MIQFQRLNMDNSWLIKINNLSFLIDPWFSGVEIDYFKWFNMQWHRYAPIQIDDVPHYDWVIITQKFPDHFHQETLKLLNPKNIIAPLSIKKEINQLLPNANIKFVEQDNPTIHIEDVTIQWFNSNKKIDPRFDAMAIHSKSESLFVATHGFTFNEQQKIILQLLPKIKLLLSPINYYKLPFFLGGVISPGLTGVKKLLNDTCAEKFVSTHDEDKHAAGFVNMVVKQLRFSAEDIYKDTQLGPKFLNINNYQLQEV